MGRKAGDSSTYTWRLWDKSAGRYVDGEDIDLPSVTTVIKATLPKNLGLYEHQKTIDLLAAGLQQVGTLARSVDDDGMTDWDYLTDGEALCEWLKDNGLTPADWLRQRGDEGHEYHRSFEHLGELALVKGLSGAIERAKRYANSEDGTERAIGQWWVDTQPDVLAPEQTIRSLRMGIAGTLDLAWRDQVDGSICITDLKSRDYKGAVWDSDRAQGGGLALLYEEQKGLKVDRSTVLVARESGKVVEEEVDPKWRDVFAHLVDIYHLTHRKGV